MKLFSKTREKSINEFHAVSQHWNHLQNVYKDGLELWDSITIEQIERMMMQKCLAEGLDVKSCLLYLKKGNCTLEMVIVQDGKEQTYVGYASNIKVK